MQRTPKEETMTPEQKAAYKDGEQDAKDGQNHEAAYCFALVPYYQQGQQAGAVGAAMPPLARKAWAEKELARQYKMLLPTYPSVRVFIAFDYAVLVDYGLGIVRRIEPAC